MGDGSDVDRYVKNTNLLIDVCLRVAESMDKEAPKCISPITVEMDAQLREIARAVDRLEKAGIQVPDALRAEKTRLAVALSVRDQTTRELIELADGLGSVIREIRSRIEQRQPRSSIGHSQLQNKEPVRTPRAQLRSQIIKSLQVLGGRATPKEVMADMAHNLGHEFLPGDLVVITAKDGTRFFAWQQSARKERSEMVKDGLLCSSSPVGVWELRKDRS